MTLNSSAIVLSGFQVVSPIRPPRLQTRASSPAAASGCLTNMTPQVEMTTSKLAFSNGSFSASPIWYSIGRPARVANDRAASIRSPPRSVPTTRLPGTAIAIAREAHPVPHARSRTRSPGRGCRRATQCSMESLIERLIWS
jgi:hypothetical protein